MQGSADSSWHRTQDEMVDDVLERVDSGLDSPSAMWRVWLWGGARLFDSCHLVNALALRQHRDSFRLLDLGCGPGELTRELAHAFPHAEILGLDSNQASINRARESPARANLKFVEGVFEDASDHGEFDLVVCSEVLEHVESPAALLSVMHDVLAPGGFASLSTPSGWMWWRPGLASLWTLATTPAEPRLRGHVGVAAVVARLRATFPAYRETRLQPERAWARALPLHPAIHPRVLRRLVQDAGFEVVARTSSLWFIHERLSVIHRLLRLLERRRSVQAAQQFFYFITMLEGLLNVFPPLRVFETRQFLLLHKPLVDGAKR